MAAAAFTPPGGTADIFDGVKYITILLPLISRAIVKFSRNNTKWGHQTSMIDAGLWTELGQ